MLSDCLRSIAALIIPPDWQADILVLDNSRDGNARSLVDRCELPIKISYAHEPKPGIPVARNRALQECIRSGHEWIAFIDDDEILDPQWLLRMSEAYAATHADVLHGQTESKFELANSFWPEKEKKRSREPLQKMATAGTDNVLFKRHLISADGMGLRFDENMQFSGGSDREFFYRASDLGAQIVWAPEARTFELTPRSRQTFWYQVRRAQSVAANDCYISWKRLGLIQTIGTKGGKAALRLTGGLLLLPLGALLIITGNKKLRGTFLTAAKDIGSALGTVRGLLRKPPNRYKAIQGQ